MEAREGERDGKVNLKCRRQKIATNPLASTHDTCLGY